jgi:hypothetical protein
VFSGCIFEFVLLHCRPWSQRECIDVCIIRYEYDYEDYEDYVIVVNFLEEIARYNFQDATTLSMSLENVSHIAYYP